MKLLPMGSIGKPKHAELVYKEPSVTLERMRQLEQPAEQIVKMLEGTLAA